MPRNLDLAGDELIAEYKRRYGRVTLQSFSGGKDSIACALAIRKKLDVVPVYFVVIPGLEFIDASMDYYERKLFGRHILRLPHPSLYRYFNQMLYQTVERAEVLMAAKLPNIDYKDVLAMARKQEGLNPDVLTAVGARAADNALRAMSMKQHGAFRLSAGAWWPIWDWNKARLVDEIRRSGISLPVDYQMFGRSFEGLGPQYLIRIKERYPADYQRILDWFPLAHAELVHYEMNMRYGKADPNVHPRGQAAQPLSQVAG